ncbi:MAG: hypothetical protein K8I27_10170 [Planctomycetes bacterium]|nr:hypothetical protein [Planctomycetota bacterium]
MKAGLLKAGVILLSAFVALGAGTREARADEGDPPTQEQIKAEKAQLDKDVENAKTAVDETQKGIDETQAKIDELEDQPTTDAVAKELDRPIRGNYPREEDYQQALKDWYDGLSEEDKAKWDKAVEDAANLRRKRSQLAGWIRAKELHDKRLKRLEDARTKHCTEFPLDE